MAAGMKKSVLWIYGQFLLYLISPREDLRSVLYQRVASAYEVTEADIAAYLDPFFFPDSDSGLHSFKNSSSGFNGRCENGTGFRDLLRSNGSLIAVHIRGGKPDAGRHPANLSYYIDAIDIKAAELAAVNRPVRLVYIGSDSQDENIQSSEFMNSHYPRPFKFSVLPHIQLGHGEVEHLLKGASDPPNRTELYIEWLADILCYSLADTFIGSSSGLYFVTTGLRAVLQPLGPYSSKYDGYGNPSANGSADGSVSTSVSGSACTSGNGSDIGTTSGGTSGSGYNTYHHDRLGNNTCAMDIRVQPPVMHCLGSDAMNEIWDAGMGKGILSTLYIRRMHITTE
jgi:hypothetical protein